MPEIAESMPTVTLTRSLGSSSRTMPIDRGRIAPAAPCSTRPATSIGSVVASPASTVPAARSASTTSRIFRLPAMSPSRARIGVRTDAESR